MSANSEESLTLIDEEESMMTSFGGLDCCTSCALVVKRLGAKYDLVCCKHTDNNGVTTEGALERPAQRHALQSSRLLCKPEASLRRLKILTLLIGALDLLPKLTNCQSLCFKDQAPGDGNLALLNGCRFIGIQEPAQGIFSRQYTRRTDSISSLAESVNAPVHNPFEYWQR